jgi:uroporphyrinogen-III synthase
MDHRALLQGQGVLVTRPEHQANEFIQMLEASGAHAIGFPAIEICPVIDSESLKIIANELSKYQIIIFISRNSVKNGLKYFENSLKSIKNAKIAAIGQSTKAALEESGLSVSLSPDQHFNSETLLAIDAFNQDQINDVPILIIKGEGGRELLQDTLKARGAQVNLAEVYRRCKPDTDAQLLLELWSQNRIQWVTVTSNETLKNLYYMVGEQGQNWLRQTPLIVPSQRCQQLAQQLGFHQILLAPSATDEAMLNTIKQNIHN